MERLKGYEAPYKQNCFPDPSNKLPLFLPKWLALNEHLLTEGERTEGDYDLTHGSWKRGLGGEGLSLCPGLFYWDMWTITAPMRPRCSLVRAPESDFLEPGFMTSQFLFSVPGRYGGRQY